MLQTKVQRISKTIQTISKQVYYRHTVGNEPIFRRRLILCCRCADSLQKFPPPVSVKGYGVVMMVKLAFSRHGSLAGRSI